MKNKILLLIIFILFIFDIRPLSGNQNNKNVTKLRFAMVVGANNGGPGRVKLRYAISDAKSIKRVLEQMGGVTREKNIYLEDPNRETFLSEMRKMQKIVNKAKREHRKVEAIFYFSGHSDEKNIFLGKDRVSYKEFRNMITKINADVRIAILDSCASGAFTRFKGGKKISPLLLDSAYDMKGFAFMTSSSSDEASQESDKIKGSFFTHFLVSGLRGAADMSGDSMVTLNEAYHYAFRETISQTEETVSGPQHPNYNIQMSGKGDVIMTDVRKSSARLVIGKEIFGRVFIHNQENVLVVEINKPYGRTIEIGLEKGKFRIINIREGNIYESYITLLEGKSFKLKISQLKETDKIDTAARGKAALFSPQDKLKKIKKRFQIEFLGGFSTLNPADLNLEVQREIQYDDFKIYDQLNYYLDMGYISSFTVNISGDYKTIKNTHPLGFRLKHFLTRSLAISLGLEYISQEETSNIDRQVNMEILGNVMYTFNAKLYPHTLSARGYIPTLGIHLGKRITSAVGLEGFLTGGLLFAQCRYFYKYQDMALTEININLSNTEYLLLELDRKGKGTGFALKGGARINVDIGENIGLFLEGGYAYRMVNKISGPGSRTEDFQTRTWQGDWGIKGWIVTTDWGDQYFQSPSNYWPNQEEKNLKIRDFKLDLSGFQMSIGIYYRFK